MEKAWQDLKIDAKSSALHRVWSRNAPKWRQMFTMPGTTLPCFGGAWRPTGEGTKAFSIGCYSCYATPGLSGPFATFKYDRMPLIKFMLDQHVSSAAHQVAIGLADAREQAPSKPNFKEVLSAVRERRGHGTFRIR